MSQQPQYPMQQIKASAGSGKTYTLTQEFLAKLLNCRSPLSRTEACLLDNSGYDDWRSIMAITFTNAAAMEMQERILTALKKLVLEGQHNATKSAQAQKAKIWLERILHDRSSLNISTIDSLLNLILRISALYEELPPDFTPAFTTDEILLPYLDQLMNEAWEGDQEVKELIQKACRAALEHSSRKTFLASSYIAKALNNIMPLYFTDAITSLTPANLFQSETGDGALPKLRREVAINAKKIKDMEGMIPQGQRKAIVYDARMSKAFAKLLESLCYDDGTKPDRLEDLSLQDFAQLHFETNPKSTYFYREEITVTHKSAIPTHELIQAFLDFRSAKITYDCVEYMYKQQQLYAPLLEIGQRIYERYTVNLTHEGKIPNDRIPLLVKRILGDDGHGVAEALCRLGSRLRHFFIDEFQDTSRSHWAAIKPLISEALASGGTFTWVGDVKQAIYGFRGGDSQLFDEVSRDWDLLCMLPSTVKRDVLPSNWRSRQEIILFNNTLFEPLNTTGIAEKILRAKNVDSNGDPSFNFDFTCAEAPSLCPDSPSPDLQTIVSYVAGKIAAAYSEQAQDFAPKTQDGGRITLATFPENDADDANYDPKAERFKALCAALFYEQEVHQRHWSEMLILVSTNKQATDMAAMLAQVGIAAITENSLLVSEHPLVVQTIALLSFLRAQDDDIAFWTLITGSIFAKADDPEQKEAVRILGDDACLYLTRSSFTDAHGKHLYERWKELCPHANYAYFEPLLKTSSALMPYDIVSEWYEHMQVWQRFPEAKPFLSRLLEIIHTCASKGTRTLDDFLEFWERNAQDEKVPMPVGMDAVRIMTIHKSKGLQAPIVFVPWAGYQDKNPASKVQIIEYYYDPNQQPLRTLCQSQNQFPMCTAQILLNDFEAINRFYVAFTRAEDTLYVFMDQKPDGIGRLLHSLFELAQEKPGFPPIQTWAELKQVLLPEEQTEQETSAAIETAQAIDPGQEVIAQDPWDLDWSLSSLDPNSLPKGLRSEQAQREDKGSDENQPSRPQDSLSPTQAHMPTQWQEHSALWTPMAWLPKLRVHFDYLDESNPRNPAQEKGIFIHHCLEELSRLPENVRVQRDANNKHYAVQHILEHSFLVSPWLQTLDDFAFVAEQELEWFLNLDEHFGWLTQGIAEQPLIDKEGRSLRTDLLIIKPEGVLVIDYKFGQPNLSHGRQLRRYITCLNDAHLAQREAIGIVVYLGQRMCQLLTLTNEINIVHADNDADCRRMAYEIQNALASLASTLTAAH